MATHILKFEHSKSTKNTECFTEKPDPGKPPVVGTLYAQKWAVGDAKEITVTIEIPDK